MIVGWSLWVSVATSTGADDPQHRWLRWGGNVTFALAATLLSFFALFAPAALDYGRCTIRGWLGTTLAVAMCVVLAEFRAPPGRRSRLLIGLAAIAFGVLVMAAVPAKGHAYRGGLLAANTTIVLFVAAMPVFLGVASVLNYVTATRTDNSASRLAKRLHLISAGLLALLAVYAAVVIPKTSLGPAIFGIVCIAASVAAGLYYAWSLSGHVNAPATLSADVKSVRGVGVAHFALVVVTLAVVLTSGAILFAHVVRNSHYLSLQLANPRWRPEFGCVGVAMFVVAALATYPVGLFVSRHAPGLGRAAARTALLAFALIAFSNTNYIAPRRVFTRAVVCLDANDGTVLWTREGLAGRENQLHKYNSPATPTALIHRDRVIAYFGATGVLCCDLDGKLLWDNREVTFDGVYGVGASPVAHDGVVVISNGMPQAPTLCALDADSGELLWRNELESTHRISGNSRTPLVRAVDGRDTVIVWAGRGAPRFRPPQRRTALAPGDRRRARRHGSYAPVRRPTHLLCRAGSYDRPLAGRSGYRRRRRCLGGSRRRELRLARSLGRPVADGVRPGYRDLSALRHRRNLLAEATRRRLLRLTRRPGWLRLLLRYDWSHHHRPRQRRVRTGRHQRPRSAHARLVRRRGRRSVGPRRNVPLPRRGWRQRRVDRGGNVDPAHIHRIVETAGGGTDAARVGVTFLPG